MRLSIFTPGSRTACLAFALALAMGTMCCGSGMCTEAATAWSEPRAINSHAATDTLRSVNDTDPQVAVGASGVVGIMWRRSGTCNAVMFRTVSSIDGTSGPVQTLFPGAASPGRIAANRNGHWIATLREAEAFYWNPQLRVRESLDNGSVWQAETSCLVSDGYSNSLCPSLPDVDYTGVAIGVPDTGLACMLHIGCVGGGSDILSQTSFGDRANWSVPIPLVPDAGDDYHSESGCMGNNCCSNYWWTQCSEPSIAMDNNGTGVAVWTDEGRSAAWCSQVSDIECRSYFSIAAAFTNDSGLTWSPIQLGDSMDDNECPSVATDGNGRWMCVCANDDQYLIATEPAICGLVIGNQGTTEALIASPGSGHSPRIAANPDGSWTCTWSNGATLRRAHSTDLGASWSAPQVLPIPAGAQIASVDGKLVAVYEEKAGSHTDIAMRISADDGATWGETIYVNREAGYSDPGIEDLAPVSATDGNGTILVVWGAKETSPDTSEPVRDAYYACVSRDNGRTWTQRRYDAEAGAAALPAFELTYSPHNQKFLLVSSGTPAGRTVSWIDPATLDRSAPVPTPDQDADLGWKKVCYGAGEGGRLFVLCPELNCQAWVRRSETNGATWLPDSKHVFEDLGQCVRDARMAYAGNDTWAIMALVRSGSTILPCVVRSTDNGESAWSASVVLANTEPSSIDLLAAPDGSITAVWFDEQVWFSTSNDRGATWPAPQAVPFPAGYYTVRLARDSGGATVLTAEMLYGTSYLVWSSDNGNTWSAPVACPSPQFPVLLSGNGQIGSAWSAPDCTSEVGCDNDIYFAHTWLPLPGVPTDLAVDLAASVGSVVVGGEYQYTLTVRNAGPVAASSVRVACTLSVHAQTIDAQASTGTLSISGQTVTVTCDALAPDEVVSATIHARAMEPGAATATATVDCDTADPDATNNTATHTTTIKEPPTADLALSKTASTGQASVSGEIVFTIHVQNDGEIPAANVMVTDPIPAGLTYVSSSGTMGETSWNNGVVALRVDALQPGEGCDMVVRTTAAAAGQITNTASAATDTGESTLANNTAVATVSVQDNSNCADLSGSWQGVRLAKRPRGGSSLRGTLQVWNRGAVASTPAKVAYWLSADTVLDAGDTRIGEGSLRAIQPGRRILVRLNAPIGEGQSGRNVIAVLDADNSVAEQTESNNMCVGSF